MSALTATPVNRCDRRDAVTRSLLGYGLLAGPFSLIAGLIEASTRSGYDFTPLGTPDGRPAHPSVHGTLHIVAGGLGFLCLIAATFVSAGTFARAGEHRWAWFSRLTGIVVAAGFAALTTGASSTPIIFGFWVAVALAFAWLGAVSPRLYRSMGRTVS